MVERGRLHKFDATKHGIQKQADRLVKNFSKSDKDNMLIDPGVPLIWKKFDIAPTTTAISLTRFEIVFREVESMVPRIEKYFLGKPGEVSRKRTLRKANGEEVILEEVIIRDPKELESLKSRLGQLEEHYGIDKSDNT